LSLQRNNFCNWNWWLTTQCSAYGPDFIYIFLPYFLLYKKDDALCTKIRFDNMHVTKITVMCRSVEFWGNDLVLIFLYVIFLILVMYIRLLYCKYCCDAVQNETIDYALFELKKSKIDHQKTALFRGCPFFSFVKIFFRAMMEF